MKKYRVWAAILPFCLTTALAACVPAEKMPVATDNAAAMQTENAQKPAAEQAEGMQKAEAGTEQQAENTQNNEAAAQTGKEQAPASAEAKPQQPPPPPADPCATTVDQLAAQARTGMKTFTGSCQEQRIEVNPMWAKNYDGAVRVRIYDAAGKLKSMETLNSKDLPEGQNKS